MVFARESSENASEIDLSAFACIECTCIIISSFLHFTFHVSGSDKSCTHSYIVNFHFFFHRFPFKCHPAFQMLSCFFTARNVRSFDVADPISILRIERENSRFFFFAHRSHVDTTYPLLMNLFIRLPFVNLIQLHVFVFIGYAVSSGKQSGGRRKRGHECAEKFTEHKSIHPSQRFSQL